jgi:hypothetical protein
MDERDVLKWAGRFWRLAGSMESYPRQLEIPVAWALPLAIVKLPVLGVAELLDWLAERRICLSSRISDRPLRACLVARAGRGVILLDGTDDADEQRLSLAHEVAHFLVDHLASREAVLSTLGPTTLEVLDGLRDPTPEERLRGVLRGVEVGVYAHLMARSTSGMVRSSEVLQREDIADRLALELLAPKRDVVAALESAGVDWKAEFAIDQSAQLLMDRFGLPRGAAERYARAIVLGRRSAAPFRSWLLGGGGVSNSCQWLGKN